jgi:hypothetical protein
MAHTAPAAPLVLHRTRIGKGPMKKFGINCQRQSKLFLIIIFHFQWKRRDECSAPLEIPQRLSYWHWPLAQRCLLRFF